MVRSSLPRSQGENINVTYSRDGHTIVAGNKKDLLTWIDVRTRSIVAEVESDEVSLPQIIG